MRVLLTVFALFIWNFSTLYGSVEHSSAPYPEKPPSVEEKTGSFVKVDSVFYDEKGKRIIFKELLGDKPLVILPVYYTCPNVCNFLMGSISSIIKDLGVKPIKDYRIVSISFDENDTPEVAYEKKKNFLQSIGDGFPDDGWLFLTSDLKNIRAFMDSLGFYYKRNGKDFFHPVVTVIINPDGKISRYLYGIRVLPFDLSMAVIESQKGLSGLSIKRVLTYCFSYDAIGKRYVFNILRVSGSIIILMLILLGGYLFYLSKKREKELNSNG